jgi:putative hemolysin
VTACTTKTPAPESTGVEYPKTQSGTPATAFCEDNGGTVSIEKQGTLDIAYCTTKDGQKIDAWKYMSDMTSSTGTTATGSNQ